MRRPVRTAYEVRSERSGRRTALLVGFAGLVLLALTLLLREAWGSGGTGPATGNGATVLVSPVPEAVGRTEPTPEGAAQAAAQYVVAVNDAGLLNDPAAQRELAETWVVAERRRSWLADLQLTQGTIASTIAESGAAPSEMLLRAHPLGYRIDWLDAARVRVEVWQLYTILGPGWPGLSGSATTELVMRQTAEGWRIEDGDEIAGPDLPGLVPEAGADTGALARDIESFTPFRP